MTIARRQFAACSACPGAPDMTDTIVVGRTRPLGSNRCRQQIKGRQQPITGRSSARVGSATAVRSEENGSNHADDRHGQYGPVLITRGFVSVIYFFSRGSGRKSAAITGEYCLSCAEFVPTSSCDRAVVHPVSCPIGWVTRPERNCGASLVGTLSPGVAPGHPVARSIRHYH